MLWKMFFGENGGWYGAANYLLLSIGGIVILLQAWMAFEGLLVFRKAKGVLEEPLPPIEEDRQFSTEDGRSC